MVENNISTEMLTATKVTQYLDISMKTLDSWYKYVEDNSFEHPSDMPNLPMYEQKYPRAPRYWKKSDLEQMKKFKDWVPKGRNGVMGRVNERFWSEKHRKNESDTEQG